MNVIDAPRSPIVPENPDSNDTSEPMEIIQKISYKESDEGLFGHGKNPEYLHPSDMTYRAFQKIHISFKIYEIKIFKMLRITLILSLKSREKRSSCIEIYWSKECPTL